MLGGLSQGLASERIGFDAPDQPVLVYGRQDQSHDEEAHVESDGVLGWDFFDVEVAGIEREAERLFAGHEDVDQSVGDHHVGVDHEVAEAWEFGSEVDGSVGAPVLCGPFDVAHGEQVQRDGDVGVAGENFLAFSAVVVHVAMESFQYGRSQCEPCIRAASEATVRPWVACGLDSVSSEVDGIGRDVVDGVARGDDRGLARGSDHGEHARPVVMLEGLVGIGGDVIFEEAANDGRELERFG